MYIRFYEGRAAAHSRRSEGADGLHKPRRRGEFKPIVPLETGQQIAAVMAVLLERRGGVGIDQPVAHRIVEQPVELQI